MAVKNIQSMKRNSKHWSKFDKIMWYISIFRNIYTNPNCMIRNFNKCKLISRKKIELDKKYVAMSDRYLFRLFLTTR